MVLESLIYYILGILGGLFVFILFGTLIAWIVFWFKRRRFRMNIPIELKKEVEDGKRKKEENLEIAREGFSKSKTKDHREERINGGKGSGEGKVNVGGKGTIDPADFNLSGNGKVEKRRGVQIGSNSATEDSKSNTKGNRSRFG